MKKALTPWSADEYPYVERVEKSENDDTVFVLHVKKGKESPGKPAVRSASHDELVSALKSKQHKLKGGSLERISVALTATGRRR
jgi:hypothetical protein